MSNKLLWISDDPYSCTGFATATKEIMGRLVDWERYVIAINQTVPREPYTVSGKVNNELTKYDVYTSCTWKGVQEYINSLSPDVIVMYGAPYHATTFNKTIYNIDCPVVLYIVIDSWDVHPKIAEAIKQFDIVLTTSKFCMEELRKVGIESTVVYHGVDTSLYRKLDVEHNKVFTYGAVAKNNLRKDLPRLIKAFSKLDFNCKLRICTDNCDDLTELAIMLKVLDRIDFYKPIMYKQSVPQRIMPIIYNSMDVYVYSGRGEAFLLPTLEAASCGVPSVVTDFPTLREILGDSALYVKVSAYDYSHLGTLAIADLDDLVSKMKLIASDDSLRRKLSNIAIERAKLFTWDNTVKYINKVLNECV